MGLTEVFFPYGNFQAGFGLAAVIWVIGLTRGTVSSGVSYVSVPVLDELMNETFLSPVVTEDNSSCLITIAAMSENGTSGDLRNLSLKLDNQVDLWTTLNGSSGGVVWKTNFEYLYLEQNVGDVSPLFGVTSDANNYLVPTKVFNDTKICLYTGLDSVTYEIYVFNSTFGPHVLQQKVRNELGSFGSECLFEYYSDSDVILVNSSNHFGVVVMESNAPPRVTSGIALEAIPSTGNMGTEFVIVTEEESEVYVMGQESSEVKVMTSEGEFNLTVTPYSVRKLNTSGNLGLQLRSSKPIQVMCLTIISNLWNTSSLNLFTVFPVEPIFCNWLEISSSCLDKACVIVASKRGSVWPVVSINGSLVTATNYSFGDYNVLEIANLRKGLHFLKVTNSNGLAVFVIDKSLGRLYQVQPLIQDQCSDAFLSSTNATTTFQLDDNNENTTLGNLTFTFQDSNTSNVSSNHSLTSVSGDSYEKNTSSSINPTLNITTEKSAFVEVTTKLVKTTKTTLNATLSSETGKRDPKNEIGGISFQFQTNQNTSNSSQHTVIGGAPSYNIFLQDVEEDDYSQEYMMAVVLSLCVAIFAVIAVISSFLLMEFISRQKQIRNTKIRPFVS